MLTNLFEGMNSILNSLPISILVKSIFEKTNYWLVERGMKIKCML